MLDQKTKAELKKIAAAEARSMADVARELLFEGIRKKKSKDLGRSLIEMAKKADRSGVGDLAERHDYYLYGGGRIK